MSSLKLKLGYKQNGKLFYNVWIVQQNGHRGTGNSGLDVLFSHECHDGTVVQFRSNNCPAFQSYSTPMLLWLRGCYNSDDDKTLTIAQKHMGCLVEAVAAFNGRKNVVILNDEGYIF